MPSREALSNPHVEKSAETPNKVALRVPATTANLGPAFDTIGMALNVFLELTVERSSVFSIVVTGEGAEHLPQGEENMVVRTCRVAFEEYAKQKMPPLSFKMHSNIPYGCGCGSSAAAAVAGFVSGMALSGLKMESHARETLLSTIADFEGHADNGAATLYGGTQLCWRRLGGDFVTHRMPTPQVTVVLFIPDKLMKASTHVSRQLLPQSVSLEDAVQNISSTAVLMAALSSGEMGLLRDCHDRLHQQQRANALYPHFEPCQKAALQAGACYAFLSGAGPTVCAFLAHQALLSPVTLPKEERPAEAVAQAMVDAASTVGIAGRALITRPSDLGVHVAGVTENSSRVQYVSI